MPRYLVERTFPNGLEIPIANGGAEICSTVVQRNAELGVTWVHSYVSEDKKSASASTTHRLSTRSVQQPPPNACCPWIGSPDCVSSTPISTPEPKAITSQRGRSTR